MSAVDQAAKWLNKGGGEWPQPDPKVKDTKRKGRKKGSVVKTKDAVYQAAKEAIEAGKKWSEFARRTNPDRTITIDEVEALKKQFKLAKGR